MGAEEEQNWGWQHPLNLTEDKEVLKDCLREKFCIEVTKSFCMS